MKISVRLPTLITSITSLPCGQRETLLLGIYGGGIREASLQYGQPLAFSQYHFNTPAIDQVAETANCFLKAAIRSGSDRIPMG